MSFINKENVKLLSTVVIKREVPLHVLSTMCAVDLRCYLTFINTGVYGSAFQNYFSPQNHFCLKINNATPNQKLRAITLLSNEIGNVFTSNKRDR